jgi:N-acetylmuramoyl-L-alanine amidase
LRDDEKTPSGGENRSNTELPASVIFMEMMRQAAAKASPPEPPAPVVEEPPVDEPPTALVETPEETVTAEEVEAVPEEEAEVEPAEEAEAMPELHVEAETIRFPKPPMTDEDRRKAAALEAQRVRRIKRRQEKRRQRRVSVLGGILRSFLVIIPSALLMATILSWWTDPEFLKPEVRAQMGAALIANAAPPTPTIIAPTPNWMRTIGIVSGHNGPGQDGVAVDPGAVCEDINGNVTITEREINLNVATRVVTGLRELGYSVDLLDEFDPRLQNYQAELLVSIHANTCQDFGELVTGYLIAKAEARPEAGVDVLLVECIAKHYGYRTQLMRRFGLTKDMTDYHSFREIHPTTPAAIIELGFMLADQQLLTEQPDLMAQGIIDGIRCYLEPEFDILPPPTATPPP